jgi:hypothetical protein
MFDEFFRIGYISGDQYGIVADGSQLLQESTLRLGIRLIEVNIGKPKKFACRMV